MPCGLYGQPRFAGFPPKRYALSCGRAMDNPMGCPPLAHRPAAAHKPHRAYQENHWKEPGQPPSFRLIPQLELTSGSCSTRTGLYCSGNIGSLTGTSFWYVDLPRYSRY